MYTHQRSQVSKVNPTPIRGHRSVLARLAIGGQRSGSEVGPSRLVCWRSNVSTSKAPIRGHRSVQGHRSILARLAHWRSLARFVHRSHPLLVGPSVIGWPMQLSAGTSPSEVTGQTVCISGHRSHQWHFKSTGTNRPGMNRSTSSTSALYIYKLQNYAMHEVGGTQT